ncbi:unnamed protein product [Darwinula stevensoni]|uniref:Uncharacterized protein n=1 Tax=Darwinula stevensoni TaxID=69355 RepID=A0A7R9A4U6_9CRUS|nr:unnamed protein product [Darwinula stevensoni]CAG0884117.1 unnamed protein product [Darwinula stevensoni]
MSGYPYSGQDGFYSTGDQQFSYDIGSGFGQEQSFQTFDYGQQASYGQSTYMTPQQPGFGPGAPFSTAKFGENETEDEPPLLEELGINPEHIIQKVS